MTKNLTLAQFRAEFDQWIPSQAPTDEVIAGVASALSDRTRPIERGLGDSETLYAWSSEDVPVVQPALKLLGELISGGFLSPKFLGVALSELVAFLIKLRKNRAEIRDPKLIAVLLTLRDGPAGGMSASDIAAVLAKASNPPLTERNDVETALDDLATAGKHGRPHPLVERSSNLWRSRV